MGGVCSRKRSQLVEEDDSPQTPTRFSKTSSLKWLLLTLPRSSSNVSRKGPGKGPGRCPTLMELCVAKVCKDISKYSTFAMLPSDLSQQIFDELVDSNCLTEESLETFRDCALHDICLGECPGVKDAWMEVVASQRQSLLSVDISCSEVTDSGINFLSDCSNMQSLSCNYCDHVSEHGLGVLSGFSNLTSLSFKRSDGVTAEGMRVLANLVNLVNLDLERCLKIHGGLVHVKGLRKPKSLSIKYCKYVMDSDIKYLSGSRTIYLFPLIFSALVYHMPLNLVFILAQVLIGKLRCMPTAPSTSLIFVDSFRLYLQRFWHVHLCFLSIGFCELTSLYLQIFWHVFKCFQSIVFCGFGLAVPPEILACLVLQLCFSSNIGMVLRLLSLVITSALMETGVQLNLSIYSCCGEGFYINKHVFASYNLLYFVCCHLTSGEKDGDELRRNLLSWRFPRERGCRDVKSPETILEQFYILWLGDLNCCICLPYS